MILTSDPLPQFTGILKSGGGGMNGGGMPRPQRGSNGTSNGGR